MRASLVLGNRPGPPIPGPGACPGASAPRSEPRAPFGERPRCGGMRLKLNLCSGATLIENQFTSVTGQLAPASAHAPPMPLGLAAGSSGLQIDCLARDD